MSATLMTVAIQTAVGAAELGILRGDELLASRTIGERFAVCRDLAAELAGALAACYATPDDLELVAVCLGPGSFTGIRIGVATAKALAHALGLPIVGVDSLETIAAATVANDVLAIIPAGRGRYFAAQYSQDQPTVPPALLTLEDLLALMSRAADNPHKVVIAGQVDEPISAKATELKLELAEATPSTTALGRIALRRLAAEGGADPLALAPFYLRQSSPDERLTQAG